MGVQKRLDQSSFGYMSNSKSEVRWDGCSLSEAESRRISSSSWSETNHSDSEPPTSLRGISCWCSCCSNTYPDRPDQNRQWKLTIKVHQQVFVLWKIFCKNYFLFFFLSSLILFLIKSQIILIKQEKRKKKKKKTSWIYKDTYIYSFLVVEAKILFCLLHSSTFVWSKGTQKYMYNIVSHTWKKRWNIELNG